MANTPRPLGPASLARIMAASLPHAASPQLKTPYEAVALAVHACMLAVGFRLLGLGEDHNLDSNDAETGASATQTPQLPGDWNASSTIAFRYAHDQSAMQFVVKISRLGSSATVDAVALGHDKRTSFDVQVADYISPSALPATPISPDTLADSQSTESATPPKALTDIFISEHRLSDLGLLVRDHIIQKLVPGLQKQGYEESTTSSSSITRGEQARDAPQPSRQPQPQQQPRNPYNVPDPLWDPAYPRGPHQPRPRIPAPGEAPPGFEDEYDILRAPGRSGTGGAGGFPAPSSPFGGNVGHDDLYPPGLGPRDPLSGSPGGMVGRQPQGMYPTPDEILAQRGQGYGSQGGGLLGGPGNGMRVPPGARYDPTHPGDPFDPLRGPGRGGGGGGGGGSSSGFGGGFSGGFGGGII